jgi:hypothetical protein
MQLFHNIIFFLFFCIEHIVQLLNLPDELILAIMNKIKPRVLLLCSIIDIGWTQLFCYWIWFRKTHRFKHASLTSIQFSHSFNITKRFSYKNWHHSSKFYGTATTICWLFPLFDNNKVFSLHVSLELYLVLKHSKYGMNLKNKRK